MQEFLMKCSKSPTYAFSLLGILINMVYLERPVRKLNVTEEQLVDWFAERIAPFPPLFQELLLRIIDCRDLHCSQLQLSPESSVKEVEMALLVLHIVCVVATTALRDDLPIIDTLLILPNMKGLVFLPIVKKICILYLNTDLQRRIPFVLPVHVVQD